MNDSHRCLVVDPHPLTRFAIRNLLIDGFEVETLTSRREAVELIQDVGGFGVTVIDFGRRPSETDGEPSGPDAVRAIRRAEPAIGIVAHGDHPARHLANTAIQAGATSYVSRHAGPEQLRHAIGTAAEQESFIDPNVPPKGSRGPLTQRQRQILEMLADGRSTTFAADALGLGEETVKTHTKNLMGRIGARNRAHAVALALRQGLID